MSISCCHFAKWQHEIDNTWLSRTFLTQEKIKPKLWSGHSSIWRRSKILFARYDYFACSLYYTLIDHKMSKWTPVNFQVLSPVFMPHQKKRHIQTCTPGKHVILTMCAWSTWGRSRFLPICGLLNQTDQTVWMLKVFPIYPRSTSVQTSMLSKVVAPVILLLNTLICKLFFHCIIKQLNQLAFINPVALWMAKTPQSFGHSECNRVQQMLSILVSWYCYYFFFCEKLQN